MPLSDEIIKGLSRQMSAESARVHALHGRGAWFIFTRDGQSYFSGYIRMADIPALFPPDQLEALQQVLEVVNSFNPAVETVVVFLTPDHLVSTIPIDQSLVQPEQPANPEQPKQRQSRPGAVVYCILERTPFPGYYLPMATWKLQKAEYGLNLNRNHYHEHAYRLGSGDDPLLLYELDDAIAIIQYWQRNQSDARYKVWAHVGKVDLPTKRGG